jgi:DNA-directed RNA polymerase subunit RPC12/RpoP
MSEPEWVKCACSHCSERLEFDSSHAGETVHCPHCGRDTVLYSSQSPALVSEFVKIETAERRVRLVPFGIVLIVVGLILGLNLVLHLNKAGITGETSQPSTPIEGLFGIKIGEPLPTNCQILYADTSQPDRLGYLSLSVIPPQTNSAFETYMVSLTPTNRLVSSIFAVNYDPINTTTAHDVLEAIRSRYGKESQRDKDSSFWSWWDGHCQLTLDKTTSGYSLSCDDADISEPTSIPADTNGL